MSDCGLDTAVFFKLDQVVQRVPGPCVCVFVVPLSRHWVLLEQCWVPLFTFDFSLSSRLPLSLLQMKLLIGGFSLVFIVDGSSHVLPEPF